MRNSFLIVVLLSLLLCRSTYAQQGNQPLQLKDIVGGKFIAKDVKNIQPLPDGEHYAQLSQDGRMIIKVAYRNGQVTDTLFHVDKVRETRLESIQGYQISSTGFRIVVWTDVEYIHRHSWKALVFDYDVRRNLLKPLSDIPGKLMCPLISPDGRMCAFVRDNDIWLKKYDYDTESEVTKDGNVGNIVNGITDWVYEEEFSITNLMVWSPDSKLLSFVKFNESNVSSYSFQAFDGSLYPGFQSIKYPKAGKQNAKVTCHTYHVETKDIKLMNIPLETDGYIPLIKYTCNSDQLAVMTLNRTQNVLNMYYVNPKSTVSRLILRDENPYYIDYHLLKYTTFTPDHFIYVGEKEGYTHIYLYSSTGILQRQVTAGDWDVTAFYGIEPDTKTVYYQSAEESPLKRSVYKMDAKGVKTKLSVGNGTNKAVFSAHCTYFINHFSNLNTPTVVTIHDNKGKQMAVLETNEGLHHQIKATSFSQKEFFSFSTQEGIQLNGWMIKPPGFSSSKKYPVLMYSYNGPNSQEVLDQYGISWNDYMATQGYIVVCVDGRGTGARGQNFKKCTYMKIGVFESDDQIAAANYLVSLPFVDKNRISIWGWSFGGTITLMCMSRGNGIFKTGIAIAPVTDWELYNTIYTERYMRTPNENAAGYSTSSPIELVHDFKGKLLLVHGTSDDNVHFQHTMHYTTALIDAGKHFQLLVFPNEGHRLLGEKTRKYLFESLELFLKENLSNRDQ